MNMNVNSSAIMPQVNNLAIPTNNKLSSTDNKFLNLLTSAMNNNLAVKNPVDQNVNVDMLNILTGMNMTNLLQIDGTNTFNSDGFSIGHLQKEEDPEEKKALENLIEVGNFFNLGNLNGLSSQIKTYESPDVFSFNNENTLVQSMNFNNQALNKGSENVLNMKNESSIISELSNFKGESKAISLSAEKLMAEIENHRDSFKSEIKMHAEVLAASKYLSQENNAIINISDESSQIKSQVLSQVKDKVVFMVDEGMENGASTKQVTMELHPVSLGKVDIKMTFEGNKLTLEIKAQNEETQKLIASNMDELVNILGKTSESVNIVLKSNDIKFEQQLYNYNPDSQKNEDFNQDSQNNGHGRQRNSYYQEKNKDNDDDGIFSQLINLRSIKLNV